MKPKFKLGDRVRVTLELNIDHIGYIGKKPFYGFSGLIGKFGADFNPDARPFDKIATLVKPKKKAPAKKKVATKRSNK